MKNIQYRIEIICIHCGYHNHFIMPVIASDGTSQIKCVECQKFCIEIYAEETEDDN